jgi:hypothetical protein
MGGRQRLCVQGNLRQGCEGGGEGRLCGQDEAALVELALVAVDTRRLKRRDFVN